MNQEIIVIEIIAFIAFIIAAIYAFLRYKKTKEITNIWLLITIALFLFALAALINVIELIPGLDILENVEVLILIISATFLFSAICFYRKERCLAKDGKDGKLKEKDGKKYKKIEEWIRSI